jgi:HEAT repeat protein
VKYWPTKADPRVWVPGLIEALRHDHPVIRAGAADALAQFGPAAWVAVPFLIEATKGKAGLAREAAAEALRKIEPEGAK